MTCQLSVLLYQHLSLTTELHFSYCSREQPTGNSVTSVTKQAEIQVRWAHRPVLVPHSPFCGDSSQHKAPAPALWASHCPCHRAPPWSQLHGKLWHILWRKQGREKSRHVNPRQRTDPHHTWWHLELLFAGRVWGGFTAAVWWPGWFTARSQPHPTLLGLWQTHDKGEAAAVLTNLCCLHILTLSWSNLPVPLHFLTLCPS